MSESMWQERWFREQYRQAVRELRRRNVPDRAWHLLDLDTSETAGFGFVTGCNPEKVGRYLGLPSIENEQMWIHTRVARACELALRRGRRRRDRFARAIEYELQNLKKLREHQRASKHGRIGRQQRQAEEGRLKSFFVRVCMDLDETGARVTARAALAHIHALHQQKRLLKLVPSEMRVVPKDDRLIAYLSTGKIERTFRTLQNWVSQFRKPQRRPAEQRRSAR